MKVQIDISNYEEYVIDYLDGNLSDSELDAFTAFLALHPKLADEVADLKDMPALEQPATLAFDRESIKMEIEPVDFLNESTYEPYFSAAADQALSQEEQVMLEAFLAKNPKLQREFNLYQATTLEADQTVVYPEKGALKLSIPIWEQARSAALKFAAILVILLTGYTVINTLTNSTNYMPRERNYDFTESSLPAEKSSPAGSKKVESEAFAVSESMSSIKQASSLRNVRTNSSIRQLVRIEASLLAPSAPHTLPSRSLAAYTPSIPQGLEAQSQEPTYASNQSGAMNLNQLVGKKVLGLNPAKTETTTALIREGLFQAINEREDVALRSNREDGKGKTLEFIAGNFGFKHVNYD